MASKLTTQETLDEIVRRIVEGFAPEKIILFGSHAKGSSGPDSDVDLLVVMHPGGSRRKKATEIDLSLVGVNVPVDVIVVTPEELQRDQDRIGTLIRPALKEGRVLYERAA
jgi:predicted nucleotidyltransferase